MTVRVSYREIKAAMLERIAARDWAPGAVIPGEEALAVEFGCARATVNRALQELSRSGVIERKRKAGSRVAVHPVRTASLTIPVVRQEIEARGATYRYVLMSRDACPAPDWLSARLAMPSATPFLHVRCLHFADDVAWQYEDRWINLGAVPEARGESFERVSPNEWLVENAPFSTAEFSFAAARIGADEARVMGLPQDEAVLVAERMTWLAGQPVTLVRMVHRPGHRIVTRI
jgi:GntR family transcriptional regulator, histidine utilization repressor